MVTEAQEQEALEKAHGEAAEAEFEDQTTVVDDNAESEDFVEVEEESKAEEDKSQKARDEIWDKERQRADQAEANYRKTSEQLDRTKATLTSQGETIKQLQGKLEGYAKANEVDLDTLDDEIVEPVVKKALKALQAKVDAATARSQALEKSRDEITKNLAAQAAKEAHTAEQTEIIEAIEEDYPAKHRNAAIAKANEICTKRGYAPKSPTESQSILRSCYKALAKEAPKAKSDDVATDTGAGTKPVVEQDNKQTTLKDRANFWRKKLKAG